MYAMHICLLFQHTFVYMKYNLKYAPYVYRLIDAAHIANFFDDPFLIYLIKMSNVE